MAVWRRQSFQQLNLETRSWQALNTGGYSFLVKGIFTDDSYEILITDLACIWEESLSEQSILERSKQLNPLIEAPTATILQQLSNRLLEAPLTRCSYKCRAGEGEVVICVEGPLQHDSGPSYQWEFRLAKAPPLLLKSHLVNPLLMFSTEMLRRQNELVGVIKRKDKEINDYKDGGAVISRKHLLTSSFHLESFEEDMTKSNGFKACSLDPTAHIGTQWQSMYQDIVSYKHWHSTQEQVSPLRPTPIIPSPVQSPAKSPLKRSLEERLAKESEKSRRDELDKKLEESKSKAKKKKKRLM